MSGLPALRSRYMNIKAGMGVSQEREDSRYLSLFTAEVSHQLLSWIAGAKMSIQKLEQKHSWPIPVILTLLLSIPNSINHNWSSSSHIDHSHCQLGGEHSISTTEVVSQLWLILRESVPLPCHNAPVRDLALMDKQDSHLHCLFTERLLQSFMSWTITMHEVQYLKRKTTASGISILRSKSSP